ncbi:MAG TPA: hypothetical protein VMO26_08705 [Vicinamibacterales bacterium]|nr:hypothetical protein [Vicinamibacterales bacterium]
MTDMPPIATWLLRRLLPHAERDEVLADLEAEYVERRGRRGAWAARAWLADQMAASIPAFVVRTCWRGWTGFEPDSTAV